MTSSPTPGLTRFNALDDSAATAELHEVCASSAWGSKLLAQRPFTTADALFSANESAMAELTAEDLAEAMGATRRSAGRSRETRPPPASSVAWPVPRRTSRTSSSN